MAQVLSPLIFFGETKEPKIHPEIGTATVFLPIVLVWFAQDMKPQQAL